MKKLYLLLVLFIAAFSFAFAQTPTLSSYPATTVITGSNTTLNPAAAPGETNSIIAFTDSRFRGQLFVSPATGVVRIVNACPAGTYTVTVKAFNSNNTQSAVTSFTLTITSPLCSPALFTSMPDVLTGGLEVRNMVVGDFNNDGKQDFAATNARSGTVSIHLGNGTGNFTAGPSFSVAPSEQFPQPIATGDFNGDGNLDLATGNFTGTTVAINLGNGNGTFGAYSSVAVSGNPKYIVVHDFNGDGRSDFASVSLTNYLISIRLGNGNGTFGNAADVPVGQAPYGLVAADFNNDGKTDLATANYNGANVSVRLGDGAGNFSGTTTVTVGAGPFFIAAGDFNGDGKADFATADNTAKTISIRYGDGTGNFTGTTTLAADAGLTAIAVSDFNGDGKDDIAGANYLYVSMWLGDGVGNFTATAANPISIGPYLIVPADFNGDGRQDVALTGSTAGNVVIRLNNTNNIDIRGNNILITDGDATPDPADYTDFGTVSNQLTRTYSISNNGNVNLVVSNITTGGPDSALFTRKGITLPAIVAPGTSTTFAITFTPSGTGLKTATVKVNNNSCGKDLYDFAIQGNAIIVVPTLGFYPAATVLSSGNTVVTPAAAPGNPVSILASTSVRFKGSLQVDSATGKVFVTNAHPAGTYPVTIKAIHGISSVTTSFVLTVTNPLCGQGTFGNTVNWGTGSLPYSVAIADFNNDGRQDIVTANSGGGSVTVRLGDGNGGLGPQLPLYINANPYAVAVGDFNGDGKPDFVTANTTSNNVSVLLGNGSGSFTAAPAVPVGKGPRNVAVGDFNGDGKPDFATANIDTSTVSIRLGDGQGNFSAFTEIGVGPAGTWPNYIALGDFNNDGITDFATANNGNTANTASIGLGNGMGNFSVTTVAAGSRPAFVYVAELNGDGNQDMVIINQPGNNISIRLGNGMGGFSNGADIPTASQPQALATGDFNGDGKTDFALVIYSAGLVTIYLGDGTGGFTPVGNVAVLTYPSAIAVGDLNGDGRQDFIATNTSVGTASIRLGSAADIALRGNNSVIPNGAAVPVATNNTDFGSVTSGTFRNFTIQNKGLAVLTVNNITISGGDSALFSITGISLPATIAAGATATFSVVFNSGTSGQKVTMVKVASNDCDEPLYSFAIQASLRAAALNFDGVDDRVTINDSTGNIGAGNITFSAWVRTTATTAASIISKQNCIAGSYFDFGLTATGKLSFALNNGTASQVLIGRATVNDGAWHHVAAVRSGATLSTYVDGAPDSTLTGTDTIRVSNTATLTIGANACSNAPAFFRGDMDEVRLYPRGLNPCEIQSNSRCELDSPQTGLLAYYRFNQGSAAGSNIGRDTLYDVTGKGAYGVLRNFALSGPTSNWVQQGGVAPGVFCTGNNIWLGITANWDAPTNWSSGFVPTACSQVLVKNGVPFMPEVSSPTSICYSLTLLTSATVVIKTGGNLTVTASY